MSHKYLASVIGSKVEPMTKMGKADRNLRVEGLEWDRKQVIIK